MIFTTIFKKIRSALLSPIPVDDNGMDNLCCLKIKNPKFIFITPSHQFPLGGTLPIQRRVQLINYSRKQIVILLKMIMTVSFRYEGSPVSSLTGLDPERVIYIGSFSKILSQALRMGYLVLPSHLIEKCRRENGFRSTYTFFKFSLSLLNLLPKVIWNGIL
ncbi:hypothetical protein NHG40_29945 [Bacillus thuringiensis]|nr:hypothetical protein [Bacillus thuringiensis]